MASNQAAFEQINNCVNGLSSEALCNCFISDLRSNIENEIAIHNPITLHQTYGLAKLIEDKLHVPLLPTNDNSQPPPTNPPLLPAPPSLPLPIKKLTPTEMQKCRAEGLCYNCPAKYQPGHHCNPPKFILLQSESEPP